MMTSRDVAVVVLRVLAVVFVVQVLLTLVQVWGLYRFGAGREIRISCASDGCLGVGYPQTRAA